MGTIYQGPRADILANTLVLSDKAGTGDCVVSAPSGQAWQAKGFITEIVETDVNLTLYNNDSGKTVLAIGGGTVVISLPSLTKGLNFKFIADSTSTLRADPDDNDNIIYSGGQMTNGEYLQLASNAKLELVASSGNWIAVNEFGNLTEETP